MLPWLIEGSLDATTKEGLWSDTYFIQDTLNISENITKQGTIVGHLFGYLILSYVVVYFASFKGVKSIGKIVYVTSTLPYLLLMILFIKGLTLEGCGDGVASFF